MLPWGRGEMVSHAIRKKELHIFLFGFQLLLNNHCSVRVRDKEGMTPCMWACRMDNIEHFELLTAVDHGDSDEDDGYERDLSGKTWMHWSVRRTEPLECLKVTILS